MQEIDKPGQENQQENKAASYAELLKNVRGDYESYKNIDRKWFPVDPSELYLDQLVAKESAAELKREKGKVNEWGNIELNGGDMEKYNKYVDAYNNFLSQNTDYWVASFSYRIARERLEDLLGLASVQDVAASSIQQEYMTIDSQKVERI